jgi:hypothetical protein
MKQGSAFPYISYAVVRPARIGFSLMTHCICHERGTRFNAVPGSTPNIHTTSVFKTQLKSKVSLNLGRIYKNTFSSESLENQIQLIDAGLKLYGITKNKANMNKFLLILKYYNHMDNPIFI